MKSNKKNAAKAEQPQAKNNRAKNPLYVVTNKGRDVQAAEGAWDAIVKKLGLGAAITFISSLLESLWQMIIQSAQNYAVFAALTKFLDDLFLAIEKIVKRVDPVLAFTLYQR